MDDRRAALRVQATVSAAVVAGLIGALLFLNSCLKPQSRTCDDGSVCPGSMECVPNAAHSGFDCVAPELIAGCGPGSGLVDGADCLVSGTPGTCQANRCVPISCGNGLLEPNEACDDGNRLSGDGCREDCGKREICGDAIQDEGEECDDENANPADGCNACSLTEWRATAIVGSIVATADGVGLARPEGVAVDSSGNIYFVDPALNMVLRVDGETGAVSRFAGTGVGASSGDGGPALRAELATPHGVAVDGLGNVFISELSGHRVRRIDAVDGTISTVAGIGLDPETGDPGDTGDHGPATLAQLNGPRGLAVDGLGNLYIADSGNHRVRKVDPSGTIIPFAGNGVADYSGDGGPATGARLRNPTDIAVDTAGNVFIADSGNNHIRKVTGGTIFTVAGDGANSFSCDGGAADSTSLSATLSIAVDVDDNLLIASQEKSCVLHLDVQSATLTRAAGTSGVAGSSGDGGPALDAQLNSPAGVATSSNGDFWIADQVNRRIRHVDASTGVIDTLVGGGGTSADGGHATSTLVRNPDGVAVDANGHLFFADTASNRVRRVDAATGIVITVAGTGGASGFSGDGGPAVDAEFAAPHGIAFDAQGNLFIADTANHRVRRVDAATGVVDTIAGIGTAGFSGDDGPAIEATLNAPRGLTLDAQGNLFIADTSNHRIRKVDDAGVITTVAGNGERGFSGDTIPAVDAKLNSPRGVAADSQGNLFIADTSNHRVRRVDASTGFILPVAGIGTAAFSGDGGAATAASLNSPTDVILDESDNLLIADSANHRIRRVDTVDNSISTIGGSAERSFRGDGGPATSAGLIGPACLALDGSGNLYISEDAARAQSEDFIRRIDGAGGTITTVAGRLYPEGDGPPSISRVPEARALTIHAGERFVAGDITGIVRRVGQDGTVSTVAGRYPHGSPTGDLARFRQSNFRFVGGVAYDADAGVLYLTELHAVHAVTIPDPAHPDRWVIATLAGAGPGHQDDTLGASRFRSPTGLQLDRDRRLLYVADTGNHVIREIDLDQGTVSTVAGAPAQLGFSGDGGPANAARLFDPGATTRCPNGDLFIADTGNNRVRRVSGGTITTVLGVGLSNSFGDGTPAIGFPVDTPLGLDCDSFGNVFVTSSTSVRMLPADDDHVVDGSGPVQTIFGAAPREEFPASASFCLSGLAVVDDHTLEITDACAGTLIRLVRTDGAAGQ